jgi:SAM-dependent methyltransferase
VSSLRAIRSRETGPESEHDAHDVTSIGPVPVDYIERNRAAWDLWSTQSYGSGRKSWNDPELRWGIWGIPESDLQLLGSYPPGSDVVELGCGTAGISAWLARAGLRPVGVDVSRGQLGVADRLQRELGPVFPLIHANAEDVPFESESFDLALSEYGASLWCEPSRWLAEANRLLRPEGGLIFVANSPLLMACTPESGERAGDVLVRDYFTGPVREFVDDGTVEFHLTHGRWVDLLRAYGFTLERLIELRPPQGARPRYDFVSNEWARRWPSEEIWVAHKSS